MPTLPNRMALNISRYVVWSDVDDDLLLFDQRSGSYHALNAVAARVWRGVASGMAVPALVEELAHQYAAPPERIRADVEKFITTVLELQLLIAGPRDS